MVHAYQRQEARVHAKSEPANYAAEDATRLCANITQPAGNKASKLMHISASHPTEQDASTAAALAVKRSVSFAAVTLAFSAGEWLLTSIIVAATKAKFHPTPTR